MDTIDAELIPEILPVDARLAVSGPVEAFQDIISRAIRVVPSKEIIPGTSYVLLEAKQSGSGTGEYLRAAATDGTITVSAVRDDIEVRLPGSALIPGQKFLSILKVTPSNRASIQILGNQALIRSGNAQWRVQLVPGNSLPSLPAVKELEPVEVPVAPFLSALKSAESAASHHAARSSLMQVEVSKGRITGMDGNRLHRAYFADSSHPLEVSIPVSSCKELIRMLEETTDEYFFAASDGRKMAFTVNRDYVVSSAILTDFPEVDTLIIRAGISSIHTLDVDSNALKEAVARVRVNSDPDFSAIFLSISMNTEKEWGLAVRAKDRFGNSAHQFLDASWSGPKASRDFCVNHRHLTSLLAAYPGDRVTFKIGEDNQSSKSPLLIEDDGIFTGLLQQMRSDFLD